MNEPEGKKTTIRRYLVIVFNVVAPIPDNFQITSFKFLPLCQSYKTFFFFVTDGEAEIS
jgi:hypothetical protein